MTLQTINIGNQVNDGLGDDLRSAFLKVNANFSSLGAELTITASNVGGSGIGLFKQRNGSTLEFKTITDGRYIGLTELAGDVISIRSTAPDAFVRIDTNSGYVAATPGNLGQITIQGNADIDVITDNSSIITVKTVFPVTQTLTTYDFGNADGSFDNAVQFSLAWANVDFGTITYPATVDLDCGEL